MGRERGGGKGSVYKQPGTRVDRDRTTRKRGIPSTVSKRDSGTGEGSSGRRGIIKGVIKGLLKELCHVLSYIVKPVYVYRAIVCMVVLIKGLCLGYK
jgi:hypothetical protein